MLRRLTKVALCVGAVVAPVAVGCGETVPSPTAAIAGDAGADALSSRPVRAACAPSKGPLARPRLSFERITRDDLFAAPVDIATQNGRLYVVEQAGKLRLLSADGQSASTVIDLTPSIIMEVESGLLGVAFHPKFAQNGFVYLSYTVLHPQSPPPQGVHFLSVVARFTSPDGGLTLDRASEKRILVVNQPFGNHNGGKILFGPDGMLYFGLGDGGSGGDPLGSGQDRNSLLGKILRVDVDGGDPYAIPPTNPFAAGGGRPEIFALGFRNPWRFSFDEKTGDLWAGDVGQAQREEIDKVTLGANYGWNIKEGRVCFDAPTCDGTGLAEPVVDYGRTEGGSVTGGVVYHGARIPELTGRYVYGDYTSGRMWSIPTNEPAPTPTRLDEGLRRTFPSVFALDKDGEIVFADYAKGSLHRFAPPVAGADPFPATLGATGCMDATDPKAPGQGLLPYDVRVPQWADGATAQRFLSLPDRSKIGILPGGRLVLPPGSLALRLVTAERFLVEAQVLERRDDGYSLYAYAWPNGPGDAVLVPEGGATVRLPSGREHVITSRAECRACHNDAAGVTLGLEIAQLDREVTYPGGVADQLAALAAIDVLPAIPDREAYGRLAIVEGFELTEPRARAYLHANCSSCHRGGAEGALDLRVTTPLRDMRACDLGARIVPGNPSGSLLSSTMKETGVGRMPPFGSRLPDPTGTRVVDDWIRLLGACP